ncbi:MAG: nitroreductase family protein [Gemmataceae bacterium]
MSPTFARQVPAESDFRPDWPPAAQQRFFLNYAVLAPSSHNTQPWLFRVVGDTAELYADRNRALRVVDPDDRELVISCGAALHHLRTAVRYFGHDDETGIAPDGHPDLLATVRLGRPHSRDESDDALFHAIPGRRTTRAAFRPDPVPDGVQAELLQAAAAFGVWAFRVETPEDKHRVAELVAEGDHIQFRDEAFRRELAHWLRPNDTHSGDGLPGYTQGMGYVASYVGPWVVRTFDLGDGTAARDGQLAEGSPLLLVLGTATDSREAWLATGQALSNLLLVAHRHGLGVSYLNQPVEVPALRPRLRRLTGDAGQPQLVLRLGYSAVTPPPTPRRPVEAVLQTLHLPGPA